MVENNNNTEQQKYIVVWSIPYQEGMGLDKIEELVANDLDINKSDIEHLITSSKEFNDSIFQYFNYSKQLYFAEEEITENQKKVNRIIKFKFIVLAELKWDEHSYADFYGFEIVRKIRTECGLNNPIIVTSHFPKLFFWENKFNFESDNAKKGRDYGIKYIHLPDKVDLSDSFYDQKDTNLLIVNRLLTEKNSGHTSSINKELISILVNIRQMILIFRKVSILEKQKEIKKSELRNSDLQLVVDHYNNRISEIEVQIIKLKEQKDELVIKIEKIYNKIYFVLELFLKCLYSLGDIKDWQDSPLNEREIDKIADIVKHLRNLLPNELEIPFKPYKLVYLINKELNELEVSNNSKSKNTVFDKEEYKTEIGNYFYKLNGIINRAKLLMSTKLSLDEFNNTRTLEQLSDSKIIQYVVFVPSSSDINFESVTRQFVAIGNLITDRIIITHTPEQTKQIVDSLSLNIPVYVLIHLNLNKLNESEKLPNNLIDQSIAYDNSLRQRNLFITSDSLNNLYRMLEGNSQIRDVRILDFNSISLQPNTIVDESFIFGISFNYKGILKTVISYDYFLQGKSILRKDYRILKIRDEKSYKDFIEITNSIENELFLSNMNRIGGLYRFFYNVYTNNKNSLVKKIKLEIEVFKSGSDEVFVFAVKGASMQSRVYKIARLSKLQNELFNARHIENRKSVNSIFEYLEVNKVSKFKFFGNFAYLTYDYIDGLPLVNYLFNRQFVDRFIILENLERVLQDYIYIALNNKDKQFNVKVKFLTNCGFSLFSRNDINYILFIASSNAINGVGNILNLGSFDLVYESIMPKVSAHNDLHCRNIMVVNERIKVIDLNALKLKPTVHAFKDYAKLYVSLEAEFFQKKENGDLKNFEETNLNSIRLKLEGFCNNIIRNKFNSILDDSDIKIHFDLCKLHYYIKYATYIDYSKITRQELLKLANVIVNELIENGQFIKKMKMM